MMLLRAVAMRWATGLQVHGIALDITPSQVHGCGHTFGVAGGAGGHWQTADRTTACNGQACLQQQKLSDVCRVRTLWLKTMVRL